MEVATRHEGCLKQVLELSTPAKFLDIDIDLAILFVQLGSLVVVHRNSLLDIVLHLRVQVLLGERRLATL